MPKNNWKHGVVFSSLECMKQIYWNCFHNIYSTTMMLNLGFIQVCPLIQIHRPINNIKNKKRTRENYSRILVNYRIGAQCEKTFKNSLIFKKLISADLIFVGLLVHQAGDWILSENFNYAVLSKNLNNAYTTKSRKSAVTQSVYQSKMRQFKTFFNTLRWSLRSKHYSRRF